MGNQQREHSVRNKGLGGLIRAKKRAPQPKLEGFGDDEEGDYMRRSSTRVMSASQIVGSDPDASDAQKGQQKRKQNVKVGADGKVIVEGNDDKDIVVKKKKGGAFQWYETNAKEAEEIEMRKREKLNELYQKKMMAKQAEEEKARRQ